MVDIEKPSNESAETAPVAEAAAPVAVRKPRKPRAPVARTAKKPRDSLKPIITLEDRFANGNFRIKEAAALCGCSVRSINKYIREKRLAVVKYGWNGKRSGCTCIPGPALASFMRGE